MPLKTLIPSRTAPRTFPVVRATTGESKAAFEALGTSAAAVAVLNSRALLVSDSPTASVIFESPHLITGICPSSRKLPCLALSWAGGYSPTVLRALAFARRCKVRRLFALSAQRHVRLRYSHHDRVAAAPPIRDAARLHRSHRRNRMECDLRV